ncbi:MAG: flippase [Ignavibacteriaceae bacterium]|jgi:O-antigen/teichoic acid export membrane protein
MEVFETIASSSSGKIIAKNTIYNLLGYGIPIIFALALMPPLIHGLGKERFGILSLVWMVIGYFSFLDLGIGRSLTKVIAEKIGLKKTEQIPIIFWSALLLMFSISVLVSVISVFFVPSLLNQYLKISEVLKPETYKIFFAVSLSIPLITTSAGLRGVLEAYQQFNKVSYIRIILGVSTFLIPLIVLRLTNSLFWIVISLISIRLIIWFVYLILNLRANTSILHEIKFSFISIKPLLKFSLWISLANIIGPLTLYSDRFIIGMKVSAVAITYYATPYEMITKLLIIPSALVTVLFPVFSTNFLTNPELSKKLLLRGIKYIFLIIYPTVLLINTFAKEGMDLWLGIDFAIHSAHILQILSIGILMNCLSLVPNIFFQGTGKPKIPTLINLSELPFYLPIMWFSITKWGITGAAITYLLMAVVDSVAMNFLAVKIFSLNIQKNSKIFIIIPLLILIVPFILTSILVKIIFSGVFLLVFSFIAWKYFLVEDERFLMVSKIQSLFKRKVN